MQNCLCNEPSQRPTAEQLVSSLEEMKADVEGSYGGLAKVDAVRQVMTVKTFQQRKKENADEVIAKDEENQQLRQQLQVRYYVAESARSSSLSTHRLLVNGMKQSYTRRMWKYNRKM